MDASVAESNLKILVDTQAGISGAIEGLVTTIAYAEPNLTRALASEEVSHR